MWIHSQDFPAHSLHWECGFSCPWCWEYTDSFQCSCWTIIDENGQKVFLNSSEGKNNSGVVDDLIDRTRQAWNNLVESKVVSVNGQDYKFYWAKTEKGKLVFLLKIWWRDIKVVSNPYIKNCILGIYKKWTPRTLWVSEQQFKTIRTIVWMFARNPEKYWLSNLQIFKH